MYIWLGMLAAVRPNFRKSAECVNSKLRREREPPSRHLKFMQFDLRQIPEPSPPPVKEPPEGPENPDVPVREPDPDEPFQM